MKENIDEIDEFLHLSHDCGIKSVRFMRLKPNKSTLEGRKVQNFIFKHQEQFNNSVRNEFQKKMPYFKKLAERLNITIETGDIQNYDEGLNTAESVINALTKKIFGKRLLPLIAVKGVCLAPWIGQLNITQEGEVLLCCESPYCLGNLNDFTLEEIWNSKKMTEIRTSFRKGYYPCECGPCKGFDFTNYPNNSFRTIHR
jgi:radical SAM protein with 4Fe4S-binding SPASM domain